MGFRQKLEPEQQIVLIAEDVQDVKRMVEDLHGTVGRINILIVGDGEKAGFAEIMRSLNARMDTHIQSPHPDWRRSAITNSGIVSIMVAFFQFIVGPLVGSHR